MKTSDHAIDKVYDILNAATGIGIFKLTKPSKRTDSEYIVINSLPMGPGVLQKCPVNVNYYVSDMQPGTPDLDKLETGTEQFMTVLEDVSETGLHIDFESQEYFREPGQDKHYSNIRLSVKLINS